MSDDRQLLIDILQEQHSHLLCTLQARADKNRAELTESITAWTKSPGPDFFAWKHLPGKTVARQTNDDRIADLVARLKAIPETVTAAPLDIGFFNGQLAKLDAEIQKYRDVLSIKRRQTELLGEYGETNSEKWMKEVSRFLQRNPIVSETLSVLQATTNDVGLEFDWMTSIAKRLDAQIVPATALPDAESSDGAAYEHSCLLALLKTGWTARLTPITGDQGADIIATKNEVSVAIQCKNYRAAVGNYAIQEIHAGKAFYEADVAVVVSPSGYTTSATLLARKLQVLLIDHASLPQLDILIRPSVS